MDGKKKDPLQAAFDYAVRQNREREQAERTKAELEETTRRKSEKDCLKALLTGAQKAGDQGKYKALFDRLHEYRLEKAGETGANESSL